MMNQSKIHVLFWHNRETRTEELGEERDNMKPILTASQSFDYLFWLSCWRWVSSDRFELGSDLDLSLWSPNSLVWTGSSVTGTRLPGTWWCMWRRLGCVDLGSSGLLRRMDGSSCGYPGSWTSGEIATGSFKTFQGVEDLIVSYWLVTLSWCKRCCSPIGISVRWSPTFRKRTMIL